MTNDEILNALPRGGRAIDAKLFKSSGLLAIGLVPLLRFMTDVQGGALRPFPEYATELFSSVRLIVANIIIYIKHVKISIVCLLRSQDLSSYVTGIVP